MTHKNGRLSVEMRASDPLLAQLDPVVDPADTRDCDGFPGLRIHEVEPTADGWRRFKACPCGDPGDCAECS